MYCKLLLVKVVHHTVVFCYSTPNQSIKTCLGRVGFDNDTNIIG
jgi:hypothetical protein